jgi:glycosyltransferase involved in cell wall biosynthesis
MTTSTVPLSVVICTWNRAESLRRTLDSLCQIEALESPWELLVIDNNSTDQTREVVESFRDRLPLRYIFEREQGLSVARNRALREFTGDVLVFTDDDVRVDRGWLAAAAAAIEAHPAIGFLGGRVKPSYPYGRPRWLLEEDLALLSGVLVHYDFGEIVRELSETDPLPVGAFFGLTRRCIESVGLFRKDLGVKGKGIGRGEETDFLERARAAGWSGLYVGTALVHHETDPRRLRLGYLYRYGIESGRAAALRNPSLVTPSWLGARARQTSFALRGLWQLMKGRGDRFRQCVINIGVVRGLAIGHAEAAAAVSASVADADRTERG